MVLVVPLVIIALVAAAIKCLQKVVQHISMHKTISSMPGPTMFSLFSFVLKVSGFEKMFEYLMSLTDVYGSPMKFWYGPANLIVMVDQPEDINIILNSENCLDKALFYNFVNAGTALIVAKKEKWKVHSKILLRAFNNKFLESSVAVVNEESIKLVESLSDKVDGNEFDILQIVSEGVLTMIFKNFLDMKWNEKMKNEYIEGSEK